MPTWHLLQAFPVPLLTKEMAATVRWSTQATQTRALTSPRGADLPAESLPCASVRCETHCMWRLETVTFLTFSQHSQGWNSALLQGYNSSLFSARYCIYSNTSLSNLSVLLNGQTCSCLYVSSAFFLGGGHRSWKAHCWNKMTFSMSCCRAGELLFSQPRLVAEGDPPVKALKRLLPCPHMLVVPCQWVWTASKCFKSTHPSV